MNILFLVLILVSVIMTVGLTELVKKFDKKNRLKGWRVLIPLLVSALIVFLTWNKAVFTSHALCSWWAVIFSLSIFSYEIIIKKLIKKYE